MVAAVPWTLSMLTRLLAWAEEGTPKGEGGTDPYPVPVSVLGHDPVLVPYPVLGLGLVY